MRDDKQGGFGEKISNAYHEFELLFLSPISFLLNAFIWPITVVQKKVFGIDKPMAGNEAMLYQMAIVEKVNTSGFFPQYLVTFEGELWKLDCDDDLFVGDEVRITYVDGLTLIGSKIE